MIYGSKTYKNGKKRGYLTFNTGKKVVLNPQEVIEYEIKLRFAEWTGAEKEKRNKQE